MIGWQQAKLNVLYVFSIFNSPREPKNVGHRHKCVNVQNTIHLSEAMHHLEIYGSCFSLGPWHPGAQLQNMLLIKCWWLLQKCALMRNGHKWFFCPLTYGLVIMYGWSNKWYYFLGRRPMGLINTTSMGKIYHMRKLEFSFELMLFHFYNLTIVAGGMFR